MTDDNRFVSTSSLQPFRFFPQSQKGSISSTWSTSLNRTVSWSNGVFPTGQAKFCLMGSNIWIYFADTPLGCTAVTLGAIPKRDVIRTIASTGISPSATPSSPAIVYGTLATAESVGCVNSPIGSLALNSPNTTVSTLEQCVDVCASYISTGIDYHYVGVQFGRPLTSVGLFPIDFH
jgi:hypothetical protein